MRKKHVSEERVQWKYRLMGFILMVAVIILTISFMLTYEVFIRRLEDSNLRSTTLAFKQTEKNIKRKLDFATKEASTLVSLPIISEFLDGKSTKEAISTGDLRKIINGIDNVISKNPDLYSIAIVRRDGTIVAATRQNRTVFEKLPADSKFYRLMEETVDFSRYSRWFGGNTLEEYFKDSNGLSATIKNPVLVGASIIDYSDEGGNSGYLLVSLGESAINECYSQIVYYQNTAMLVDDNGYIISGTDVSKYGEKVSYSDKILNSDGVGSFGYSDEQSINQVIYYPLSYFNWVLINQIPNRIYKAQANEMMLVIVFVGLATILLMSLFFAFWIFKYAKPIDNLITRIKRVELGNLTVESVEKSGIAELDLLSEQFNTTILRLDMSIRQLKAMEEQKRIEELKTLQYQINPHFLYNSINSIRWMSMMANNTKVADSLVILAKIITPILKSPSFFWSVSEEIDFVDSYIKMLTLRYGGTLNYQMECDSGLYNLQIPRFTLQPIIENCFTHGMTGENVLQVSVKLLFIDERFKISVNNNGKLIEKFELIKLNAFLRNHDDNISSHESIGLRNVNKRLFLLYGENSRMWIESNEKENTTVFLDFGKSQQ